MSERSFRRLFTAEQIAKRVAELGRELRADAGSGEIFLLGILKGSAVFVADLLRAIDGPVTYSFIDVVRDEADTGTATALEIDFISHTDIRDRYVYLVKDVVTTGVIENYLVAQLRGHAPKFLRVVALLDRPEARTMELEADFRAFEVKDGPFVGYGLELGGQYANLPFIAQAD